MPLPFDLLPRRDGIDGALGIAITLLERCNAAQLLRRGVGFFVGFTIEPDQVALLTGTRPETRLLLQRSRSGLRTEQWHGIDPGMQDEPRRVAAIAVDVPVGEVQA